MKFYTSYCYIIYVVRCPSLIAQGRNGQKGEGSEGAVHDSLISSAMFSNTKNSNPGSQQHPPDSVKRANATLSLDSAARKTGRYT